MTQLYEINVKLSENQKKNLSAAYHKKETIVLRLTKDSLSGKDTLYVPAMTKKRLEKNRRLNKGMDIKLAKTNIRKQVGGSLLTSILALGRAFGPTIAKTLGLSALGGLASEGASQLVKKISGKGVKTGGFLIPQNKIDKLIAYKHLLSEKQKKDILAALQSGSGVRIKPTKTQSGGLPWCFTRQYWNSSSIENSDWKGCTPNWITKTPTPPKGGRGAPRMGMYTSPPPFLGTWDKQIGMGKKNQPKKREKEKVYC